MMRYASRKIVLVSTFGLLLLAMVGGCGSRPADELSRATWLLTDGEYDAAIQCCDEQLAVIAEDDQQARSRWLQLKGRCFYVRGLRAQEKSRQEEADRDLKLAIELLTQSIPTDFRVERDADGLVTNQDQQKHVSESLYNRSLAYAALGQVDESEADYATAKSLDPKHAIAYANEPDSSRGPSIELFSDDDDSKSEVASGGNQGVESQASPYQAAAAAVAKDVDDEEVRRETSPRQTTIDQWAPTRTTTADTGESQRQPGGRISKWTSQAFQVDTSRSGKPGAPSDETDHPDEDAEGGTAGTDGSLAQDSADPEDGDRQGDSEDENEQEPYSFGPSLPRSTWAPLSTSPGPVGPTTGIGGAPISSQGPTGGQGGGLGSSAPTTGIGAGTLGGRSWSQDGSGLASREGSITPSAPSTGLTGAPVGPSPRGQGPAVSYGVPSGTPFFQDFSGRSNGSAMPRLPFLGTPLDAMSRVPGQPIASGAATGPSPLPPSAFPSAPNLPGWPSPLVGPQPATPQFSTSPMGRPTVAPALPSGQVAPSGNR